MSSSWNPSRRELTLFVVVLLVAACGGRTHPSVVGHYLVYSRGYDTLAGPRIVLAREQTLLGRVVTPHAWDVGIRIDVATGRFTHVHGYPVGLSRDGRFALAFGGRATGGPGGGPQPPEWIAALPFGPGSRRHVLALGDICCPSWNR